MATGKRRRGTVNEMVKSSREVKKCKSENAAVLQVAVPVITSGKSKKQPSNRAKREVLEPDFKHKRERPGSRSSVSTVLAGDTSSSESLLSPFPMGKGGDLTSALEHTNPSVTIKTPAQVFLACPFEPRTPPAAMQRVLDLFHDIVETNVGIIPHELKELFKSGQFDKYLTQQHAGAAAGDHAPTSDELFPDHLFDNEHRKYPLSTAYISALPTHVLEILHGAGQLTERQYNEQGWASVVQKILGGLLGRISGQRHLYADNSSILGLEGNVNTKLDSQLHPVNGPNNPVQSSRVDYVVGFDSNIREVYEFMRRYPLARLFVHRQRKGIVISFMGIETKSYDGNYFDASYQCIIHSTAVLTLWDNLRQQGNDNDAVTEENDNKLEAIDLLPIPSIVVLGNDWSLHWTYWDSPGNIVHVGPYPIGSTASFIGTLKLLAVVRRLEGWAEFGRGDGKHSPWQLLQALVQRAEA